MDDRKEKTGFWQSWMTIAILLAVTIMVVWFNSQGPAIRSESDENISIRNNENIQIGKNGNTQIENSANIKTGNDAKVQKLNNANIQTGNDTNVSTDESENDKFFKNWVVVSFDVIRPNLDCISTAGYKKDIVSMERCGRFLSDNSNLSLKNMNEYNISPSMKNLAYEYKQALEDYNAGGMNLSIGAKSENFSQMGIAVKYIQRGNQHIEVVNVLYEGNESSFIHPQPGANVTNN